MGPASCKFLLIQLLINPIPYLQLMIYLEPVHLALPDCNLKLNKKSITTKVNLNFAQVCENGVHREYRTYNSVVIVVRILTCETYLSDNLPNSNKLFLVNVSTFCHDIQLLSWLTFLAIFIYNPLMLLYDDMVF